MNILFFGSDSIARFISVYYGRVIANGGTISLNTLLKGILQGEKNSAIAISDGFQFVSDYSARVLAGGGSLFANPLLVGIIDEQIASVIAFPNSFQLELDYIARVVADSGTYGESLVGRDILVLGAQENTIIEVI